MYHNIYMAITSSLKSPKNFCAVSINNSTCRRRIDPRLDSNSDNSNSPLTRSKFLAFP